MQGVMQYRAHYSAASPTAGYVDLNGRVQQSLLSKSAPPSLVQRALFCVSQAPTSQLAIAHPASSREPALVAGSALRSNIIRSSGPTWDHIRFLLQPCTPSWSRKQNGHERIVAASSHDEIAGESNNALLAPG